MPYTLRNKAGIAAQAKQHPVHVKATDDIAREHKKRTEQKRTNIRAVWAAHTTGETSCKIPTTLEL